MIRFIRKIFNRPLFIRPLQYVTGTKCYRKIPMGVDPFVDIEYYLPNFELKTIFDVGANIGQTSRHYRKRNESAEIYSFEPVKETYNQLINNTSNHNINCFNYALGNESGQKKMSVHNNIDFCVSNTILETEKNDSVESLLVAAETVIANSKTSKVIHSRHSFGSEMVTIEKLDNFVVNNNIRHINYLKIDTEGYDLEVLKGAQQLIRDKQIDFIETEVSMNPTNEFHVSFTEIKEFMLIHDYLIFGLYEQILDFKIEKPVLRRSNVVFISSRIYNSV